MGRRVVPVVAFLLVGACGTSRLDVETVPDGTWGGDDAGLVVRADSAHAHIGCTLGDLPAPIAVDRDGRFEVEGQWNVDAYPVNRGILHPARVSGRTDGRTLTFSVRLTDTGQVLGPSVVTLGREPRMVNCPICRLPSTPRAR
jgi:hypothetical protein